MFGDEKLKPTHRDVTFWIFFCNKRDLCEVIVDLLNLNVFLYLEST